MWVETSVHLVSSAVLAKYQFNRDQFKEDWSWGEV